MWTPYQIEIILHHHASFGEFPRRNAPAYGETLDVLVEVGVLHRNADGFLTTTECGAALVEMWKSTPMPQQAWIDPRTGERLHHGPHR